MQISTTYATLLFLLSLAAPHSLAQSPAIQPSAADDGSSFSLTFSPYAWFPSVGGNVGAAGLKADVDSSFADIVNASDDLLGLFGRLEARFDRFGFYADGGYMRIGVEDATGPLGLANIEVVQHLAIVDFGLEYRLLDHRGNDSHLALDATIGARYWNAKVEIEPAMAARATRDRDWIDPTVGLRSTIGLGDRWQIVIGGDIGGFSVSSDFSWSAIGTIEYSFSLGSLRSSVFAGYKAIGDDFTEGSFTIDTTLHGPILGMRFMF